MDPDSLLRGNRTALRQRRDFDYALLSSCDHVALTMGTFGSLAAILGRSQRVFMVEFFPHANRRLPVAHFTREDGLAARDSYGRGRCAGVVNKF